MLNGWQGSGAEPRRRGWERVSRSRHAGWLTRESRCVRYRVAHACDCNHTSYNNYQFVYLDFLPGPTSLPLSLSLSLSLSLYVVESHTATTILLLVRSVALVTMTTLRRPAATTTIPVARAVPAPKHGRSAGTVAEEKTNAPVYVETKRGPECGQGNGLEPSAVFLEDELVQRDCDGEGDQCEERDDYEEHPAARDVATTKISGRDSSW